MLQGATARDAAAPACRKRLRVDHTRVAGPFGEFPLLVAVTDAALKARVHGGCVERRDQLYFTGGDGESLLDFDLEEYDPNTGAVRAWVRIPGLSPVEDAVLHLCCGDRQPGPADSRSVWDPHYRLLFPPGEAGMPDDFISPCDDLGIADSMTAEAWVRCDEDRAEALQVIAAQWSWRQEMGGFDRKRRTRP